MITSEDTPPELASQAFATLSRRLFSEWIDLRKDQAVVAAIRKSMRAPQLQPKALELVDDLEDPAYGPDLLAIAKSTAAEEARVSAIRALGRTRDQQYLPELENIMRSGPLPMRVAAVRAIGYAKTRGLDSEFQQLILS